MERVRTDQIQAQNALKTKSEQHEELNAKHDEAQNELQALKPQLAAREKDLTAATTRYAKAEGALEDAKAQASKVPYLEQRCQLLQDEADRQSRKIAELQDQREALNIKAQQQEKLLNSLQPLTTEIFKLRDLVAEEYDLSLVDSVQLRLIGQITWGLYRCQ